MSLRLQRLLIIFLVAYYTLFGGSYYTEHNPPLRVAHQVGTALLFALWLITLWREGQLFPATPLDRPLLAYAGVLLASAILSRDARLSLEYTWPLLTHILGFYLLVDLMRRGRQRWVFEALFVTGAVIVTLTAIEMIAWYFGLPLAPQFVQGWPQVFGLTLPPITHKAGLAMNVSTLLGNFTATTVPLAAGWAMTARRRDLRQGAWLLAGALTVVLLLTQSRSALLALGASVGLLALFALLRQETQARFPAALRPLLERRALIGGAALAGALIVGAVLWAALRAPRSGDVARLDLWHSAVAMTRDAPLLGVGPHLFGATQRLYGDRALAASTDRLVTAHNLPLNTLAETGVIGLAAALWVGAAFLRMWQQAWRRAEPGRRLRLEACLAALAGFGVQSLVDTFALTQTVLPVLMIAAYTAAGGVTRAEAVRERPGVNSGTEKTTPSGLIRSRPGELRLLSRRLKSPAIPLLLLALLGVELAFLPVHAGELAHGQALRAAGVGDLAGALAATRAAHTADPWLGLYPLQEAYLLGLLAERDPAVYLEDAITAHERALALSPTWDLGRHNLAALYAQAGRVEEAVTAEEQAVRWNPLPAGYHLKLGEYQETLHDFDAARAAYVTALRANPNLGASGFWSEPGHPERATVPGEAIDGLAAGRRVDTGLWLAIMAGDRDRAAAIAARIAPETAPANELRALAYWAAWLNDERLAPCPECFYARIAAEGALLPSDDVLLAELALRRGDSIAHPLDLTPEQAARLALFASEGGTARAWYVLAQVAEQAGADDATINGLLARAVPPVFARQEFAATVYGRISLFDELPQARTPALGRYDLEPWFALAERYTAAGLPDRARRVYAALLLADPYLWDVRQQMEE